MLDADSAAIARLHDLVVTAHARQMDPSQFWIEFARLADGVHKRAYEDDADPELHEAFCDVLANADDAGFVVP
ncbi:MAG: hypothetical protein EON58_10730 [Alphaproteobacteria bacterium]|nr:MAG: hypothetical protein EON58_10730 [Alphaproteobacteria bacterium]